MHSNPVADKIIVCTALVLIVEYYSVHVSDFFPHVNLLVSIPAMVIIARGIVVSALREWMAEMGQKTRLLLTGWVKWKTAIQMTAIALLVWRYNDPLIYAALGLLQVATILTLWSMIVYLKAGLAHMTEDAVQVATSAPATKEDAASVTAVVSDEAAKSQDDSAKAETNANAETNTNVEAQSSDKS